MRAQLVLVGFGISCLTSTVSAQDENPDGSFNPDIGGEVTAELIYVKGAFRTRVVFERPDPPPLAWSGSATCTLGAATVNDCLEFFDTSTCYQGDARCTDEPLPGKGVDCRCQYNSSRRLGFLSQSDTIRVHLLADDRANGVGFDYHWSYNPAENSDGEDHLRTYNMGAGLWRLEWEDLPGLGDEDFNDVVLFIKIGPPRRAIAASKLLADRTLGAGCKGTVPTEAPPVPPITYTTNITVDPIGVPDRHVRLTVVLFNGLTGISDGPAIAVCPMLRFNRMDTDSAGFVNRTKLEHRGFGYVNANGIPDFLGIAPPLSTAYGPSVRFSREFVANPPSIIDAFDLETEAGDIVRVPWAIPPGLGTAGLLFEVRIADLDAAIPDEFADERLEGRTADDIKDALIACNEPFLTCHTLYTDILYNFQQAVLDAEGNPCCFVCPSGTNTFFDAEPSCAVAQASYVWNPATTVQVASPVSVSLALHSTEGHAWTEPQEVILDVIWTDNLGTTEDGQIIPQPPGTVVPSPDIPIITLDIEDETSILAGIITLDPPRREPFVMTPDDGRSMFGRLDLDLPDDLPEGFLGTAHVFLTHLNTGDVIVTNAMSFAKDDTPPTILSANTARSATGMVEVFVEAQDAAAGLGDLTLRPSMLDSPLIPKVMRWEDGDYRGSTSFFAEIGPYDDGSSINLSLTVRDEFKNAIETTLPIASAGSDEAVIVTTGELAELTLDATASTGDGIVSYTWTGPFGTIAGATPLVELEAGSHEITLSIQDARGYESTDAVTITVQVLDVDVPVIEIGPVDGDPEGGNGGIACSSASVAMIAVASLCFANVFRRRRHS